MFKLISALAILFLMVVVGIPAAYAEDVITIIPCSSNHNNPRDFSIILHMLYKKVNKYVGITLMT
jgi:hypothetical protein